MHKFLLPFVLLAQLFSPTSYTRMVDHASASIVRITGTIHLDNPLEIFFYGTDTVYYVCSGFVIAPHRVLTANHCLEDKHLLVDGKPVSILKAEKFVDLALLSVDDTDKPVLTVRAEPVERFEKVTSIGYGYGFTKLLATDHKVILVDYKADKSLPPMIIVEHPYIGGMSGGPLVDMDGNVVGVIQDSSNEAGFSVNSLTIRVFLLGTDTTL